MGCGRNGSVLAFAVLAGFLAAAIPPMVTQVAHSCTTPRTTWDTSSSATRYWRNSAPGPPADELRRALDAATCRWWSAVVAAGKFVFSAISGTVIVVVLTAYFLADFAHIHRRSTAWPRTHGDPARS